MPVLHDGDIRLNAMAFVSGQNNENLPVYRYDGAPGSKSIEICYAYKGPNGKFESPSFSPDRARLAWNEDDGIHVSPSGIDAGCHPEQVAEALTIPGGRYPDWGAADVPGPRPSPGGGTTTTPGGTTGKPDGKGGGTNGGQGGQAEPRLQVGAAKLAAALKRGLVVTVSGASGKVALTATVAAPIARKAGLGGKATKVASGSAQAGGGGASVRLRFTPKAARKLTRLGTVKLPISGAGTATTATLKR